MKTTKIIAVSISIAAIAANLQPVSAEEVIRSKDVKLSSVCGKVNDNTVGLGEIMLSGKVLNSKGNAMTAVLALKNAENRLVNAKIKNFVPQSDDEEFKISFEDMYDTIGITAEGYLWDGVTMEPVTTKAKTVQMTTLSGDDFTAQNGAEIASLDGVVSLNKAYTQGYCANWFTSLMKYSFDEPINLRDGQRLTFDCKFLGNPLDWARSFAVCFNGSSSYSQLMVNTDSKFYAGGIVTPISKDKWYGIHFDVNYNYQSTGSGGTLCRAVLYDPDTGEKIAEHAYNKDSSGGMVDKIESIDFSSRIPAALEEEKNLEIKIKDVCFTRGNTPEPVINNIEIEGENLTAAMCELMPLSANITGDYLEFDERAQTVRYEIEDVTGKAVMYNNALYPIKTGDIKVKAVSLLDGTQSEAKTVSIADADVLPWQGVNSANVVTEDKMTTFSLNNVPNSYIRMGEYTLPKTFTTSGKTVSVRFDFKGGNFLQNSNLVLFFNSMVGNAPVNIIGALKASDGKTLSECIKTDEWYSLELLLNTDKVSNSSEAGGKYKNYTLIIKDSTGEKIYSATGTNNSSNYCKDASGTVVGTPSIQPEISKVAIATRNTSNANVEISIKNFRIGYDLYSSLNNSEVNFENGTVNVSKTYANKTYYEALLWTEPDKEYSTNAKAVELSFMTKGNNVWNWARQAMIFNNAQGNPTVAIWNLNNAFDLNGYKTAFEDGKWYRIKLVLNPERKTDAEQTSKKYTVEIFDENGQQLFFNTQSNASNATYVPSVIKTIDWNARIDSESGGTWEMSVKDLMIRTLD